MSVMEKGNTLFRLLVFQVGFKACTKIKFWQLLEAIILLILLGEKIYSEGK